MQDWHIPLILAAAVFLAFLLWRMRPAVFAFPSGKQRANLREAQARIEAAKDDAGRAVALCDAADASAAQAGGVTRAIGFYLRAMRSDPRSAEIVERAAAGLARRPRALESLLWRRLGAEAWSGDSRAAAKAALRHLAALYDGPLRNAPRARALENALGALGGAE
jgi:hypothetical protein